jgi:diadenylate cyclase
VLPDRAALIRDYGVDPSEAALDDTLAALSHMPQQELLDLGRLAEVLGHDRKANPHDLPVSARGYRALGRIPRLPRLVGEKVVQELGSLEAILAASESELTDIEGVGQARATDIREGLDRIREVDVFERYPQM